MPGAGRGDILSSAALRLRPSLTALRQAVGLPEPVAEDEGTPTLTPRAHFGSYDAAMMSQQASPVLPRIAEVRDSRVDIDYSKSFFYKPGTPPAAKVTGSASQSKAPRKQRSLKSLRANLLLPVAPPLPALPSGFPRTPPLPSTPTMHPPLLAISSPGACEAGRPPRELVLEGEEWDARDGRVPGEWAKKRGKGKLRRRNSKKTLSES